MALDTKPDWRCTNRKAHGNANPRPPAAWVVRSPHTLYGDILLRCDPCVEELREDDDIWPAARLAYQLKRAPKYDLHSPDDIARLIGDVHATNNQPAAQRVP